MLSDSRTALSTISNLRDGHPPIEVRIKQSLALRHSQHNHGLGKGTSRRQGQLGGRQTSQSYLGRLRHSPHQATAAGLAATGRKIRSQQRRVTSYGHNNSTWNRRAPSAYTQLRTNKGPFGHWLHRIGSETRRPAPAVTPHRMENTSRSAAPDTDELERPYSKAATPGKN